MVYVMFDMCKIFEAFGVMVSRIVCFDCGAKILFFIFVCMSVFEVLLWLFDINVLFDGVNFYSKCRLFMFKGKWSGFFKSTFIFTFSSEAYIVVCLILIV